MQEDRNDVLPKLQLDGGQTKRVSTGPNANPAADHRNDRDNVLVNNNPDVYGHLQPENPADITSV
jgi:hypothetical protein